MSGQQDVESISARIARGEAQNNTDDGAIVPFPPESDFNNPISIMRSYDRSWIAGHLNRGAQLSPFVYKSEQGEPIFTVLRMDCPAKGKDIRPLRCEHVIGVRADAAMRHLEGLRPLYNLDHLAARQGDRVLIVEGEKTADAAQSLFPGYVASTWPGGAQSVNKIELLPLVGRHVTIWPDNDAEGRKAANRLAFQLIEIGVGSCRIVQVPDDFPEKWDLADALEGSEFGIELLERLLSEAPEVDANQLKPVGKTQRSSKPTDSNDPVGADLNRDEDLLRFLINKDLLNLSERSDWICVGIAIHASHGAVGFELWDRLSSEADGYDPDRIKVDWASFNKAPDGGPRLTMATFAMRARDNGWSPKGQKEGAGQANKKTEDHGAGSGGEVRFGKNVDPAAAAVHLAEEAGDEFWVDQHDKPHVSYTVKTPDDAEVTRHAPIASGTFKRELGYRYHQAMPNKVLGKDHLSNAATLLEYAAREGGLRFQSSLRVGEIDGRIYVDLGRLDGAAIEVDTQGWRVIANPPVRFVRGTRGELPEPEPEGTLGDFSKHFNLSEPDVLRAVAFMVGTFNLSGSYPILFIEGEQGTCKSTLADLMVALTDPPTGAKSARFSFAPDEKDFHVSASGARVLCFDNISNFSAGAADALCRMATGAASSSRKLYTDDEEVRLVVLRPVIATCIGLPSSRADLLSRAVRVRTLPVERRRTEAAVMRSFNADRPAMLGFLMTCISAALRNREAVEEAAERGEIRLPRMGDFGLFIEAAAGPLGLAHGEFSLLVEKEQTDMQVEAAQDHPVGAALLKYFAKPGAQPIVAPAREVLSILQAQFQEERRWPATNKLGNELTRIAVGLRLLGIEFATSEPTGRDNVLKFHISVTSSFRGVTTACSIAEEPF